MVLVGLKALYSMVVFPNQGDDLDSITWKILRVYNLPDPMVGGSGFSFGKAAVMSVILVYVGMGNTILTQSALYNGTYLFLKNLAPRYGIMYCRSRNIPQQIGFLLR
jgi:hypothetical protein